MYSFNADLAGYQSDIFVQWMPTSGGGWEGSFEYNVDWLLPDDVYGAIEPGRYTLIEEARDYEIDVHRATPVEEGIYRVTFRGIGEKPMERSWRQARDLRSSLSWDEQVMQRIQSGEKNRRRTVGRRPGAGAGVGRTHDRVLCCAGPDPGRAGGPSVLL